MQSYNFLICKSVFSERELELEVQLFVCCIHVKLREMLGAHICHSTRNTFLLDVSIMRIMTLFEEDTCDGCFTEIFSSAIYVNLAYANEMSLRNCGAYKESVEHVSFECVSYNSPQNFLVP